jgi:hypothetical protein
MLLVLLSGLSNKKVRDYTKLHSNLRKEFKETMQQEYPLLAFQL